MIIQHARTKDVLMLGFTNREAVERTLQTKTAWFWSRSRGKLWNKGETSGHFLHVEQILPTAIPTPCSTFACPTALPVTQDETVAFFRRLCYDTHSSAGELTPRFGERIGECL